MKENDFIKFLNKEFKDYYVPDLNCSQKIDYLFIFESPHTDEVKAENRCPVAGNSGKKITGLLDIDSKEPFGRLLKNKETLKNPILNRIGIMNVCNWPLQKKVYSLEFQKKLEPDQWSALEKMRKKEIGLNDSVRNDFIKRFEEIYKRNPSLKILVFGRFAENVFLKSIPSAKIHYFPHPSFFHLHWKGNIIRAFKEIFKIIE